MWADVNIWRAYELNHVHGSGTQPAAVSFPGVT
jgi:hypothetical protein